MTDLERFNRLIAAGILAPTALDVLAGKVSEVEALADVRRRTAATALLKLKVADRPQPDLAWDLGRANWHRALDHCEAAAFAQHYPDAAVVSVVVDDLVANLAETAQRRTGPWSKAYRHKTGGLVAHLEAGGLVTPPMVVVTSAGLAMAGGYRRLGWAQFRGARMLPVLVSRQELQTIQSRLATLVDDGGAAALKV